MLGVACPGVACSGGVLDAAFCASRGRGRLRGGQCFDIRRGEHAAAQFFQTMQEADASTLLSSLLGEDDPRFAQLGQLLDDESTCAEALGALREISSMPYERWGPAAAVRSLPRPLSLAPALLKAASTAPNPHHALLVDCRCIAAQSPADA